MIIETILIVSFIFISLYYFVNYSSFIILKNPKNEAVIYDRFPEIIWKGTSNYYNLIIDNNKDFETPLINTTVNITDYKVNRRLDFGTYYLKIIDPKNNKEKTTSFTVQSLVALELDNGIKNVGNTKISVVNSILVTGAAVLEINQVLNKKLMNETLIFEQDE